jgi:multisubunit Na+/H+ antiporter MnhF subunit
MTLWLAACAILMAPLTCATWRANRGPIADRLVALMFAGEIATLIFLGLGVAYHRDFYLDCALTAAILPFPSSITYAHFFERWV